MRKVTVYILILVLVLAGLLAVWFFLHRQTEAYSENSAFRAIPLRTPLIVDVADFKDLLKKTNQFTLLREFRKFPELGSFWSDLDRLDVIVRENEQLGKVLDRKRVLVAFNPEGKDNIGCLFVFSLQNRNEKTELTGFF